MFACLHTSTNKLWTTLCFGSMVVCCLLVCCWCAAGLLLLVIPADLDIWMILDWIRKKIQQHGTYPMYLIIIRMAKEIKNNSQLKISC